MTFHSHTSSRSFASAVAFALSAVALFAIPAVMLAGCSQEPIFADIEKEVELIDPSVRGTVVSLVNVGGNLYTTNGRIYVRNGGTGGWNQVSLPSGAYRCGELATDGANLYGRFTTDDYAEFHSVQRYDSGTWIPTTGISNCILIGSGNGRIYGFTGEYANANIQATTGLDAFGSVFATGLNGPNVGSTSGNYVATLNTLYSYDGTTWATVTGPASPTLSGVKSITTVGANVYAVGTGYVWRFDGTATWTSVSHSAGKPTSIAYLGGSNNLLLVSNGAKGSGTGGYVEVPLDGTFALAGSSSRPGNLAQSSISADAKEQFESSVGKYAVYSIFTETTNVPAGNAYVVYAGVIDSAHDGMWSYYPGTRAEWNRE